MCNLDGSKVRKLFCIILDFWCFKTISYIWAKGHVLGCKNTLKKSCSEKIYVLNIVFVTPYILLCIINGQISNKASKIFEMNFFSYVIARILLVLMLVVLVKTWWTDRHKIFKLWKWLHHACFMIYMFTLQFECLN